MDSEDPESPDPSPPSTAMNPEQEPHLKVFAATDEPMADDPPALLKRLIEEGEWPAPELLEQIVQAGDASVEPLIAFVQTRPRGRPASATLEHVIGLLSMLRPSSAIRELIDVIKCYKTDPAQAAIDALVAFGAPGFNALIELCHDPTLDSYRRVFVIEGAAEAASDDPDRRSRLAQTLHPILEELIAKAREELRLNGFIEKSPPEDDFADEDVDFDELDEWAEGAIDEDPFDEEDELGTVASDLKVISDDTDLEDVDSEGDQFDDDDDDEIQLYIAEELGYVVDVLAERADPWAQEPIMAAFREGLVDESIVDQAQVEDYYNNGGEPEPTESAPAPDWLSSYREYYEERIDELNQPIAPPPTHVPRPKYGYQDRYEEPGPPPGIPVTAPIRNDGPKLGRNDPCWCGSGKKYKKCHLGKDPAP